MSHGLTGRFRDNRGYWGASPNLCSQSIAWDLFHFGVEEAPGVPLADGVEISSYCEQSTRKTKDGVCRLAG